jgi:hypothetical protein
MVRSHRDSGALGAAAGAAGVAPVDPAETVSYSRRPAANASAPVIGVAKAWVVRFVVRFVRIGFSPQARHGFYLPRLALGLEGHRAANCHFGCARIQLLAKFCGKAETTRPPSFAAFELCQNCAKTLSIRCAGSCYLSESSFPKLLITCTSV